jgi:hypothetical protein
MTLALPSGNVKAFRTKALMLAYIERYGELIAEAAFINYSDQPSH